MANWAISSHYRALWLTERVWMLMIKVAIIAGSDLRNYGGGEKDIIGWTSRLKERLDITIYSLIESANDNKHKVSKEYIERSLEGIKLIWYKGKRLRLLKDVLPYERIDVSEYDKVYSMCHGFILNRMLRRTAKNFLIGIHVQSMLDANPIENKLWKRWLHFLWRIMLVHYIKKADEIRIQNLDDLARLKSIGYKGKIWNVPPRMFDSTPEPLQTGEFIVVWVNRVEPEKRPEEMVRICNSMPDIEFHLIGGGSKMDVFKMLTNKKAKVMGFLTDGELAEEFMKASAYVSTSRGENFGMSAVEAQAFGVPTIVYDVMGLRDFNEFIVMNYQQAVAYIDDLHKQFQENPEKYLEWRRDLRLKTIDRFSDKTVLPQILEMMSSNSQPPQL